MAFISHIKAVFSEKNLGKLWYKVVNTCQFEIRVKQVVKDLVKAFPNGLYGSKIAEKHQSFPPRLLGITNSIELERSRAVR